MLGDLYGNRAWLILAFLIADVMRNTLKLVLPVIIPSWRFFDAIAPSPRIEYALLTDGEEAPIAWVELRPRPKTISFLTMLRRILWNPVWNETLFLVSCSERLLANPTQHSEDEIFDRVFADIALTDCLESTKCFVQFRLMSVHRELSDLVREETFRSAIRPLDKGGAA
ncbi:hypothetical protein [Hirschia baltica]|uniref:hypothetical protein n=1 Tax=Hirschia baltica TaxID=2724 RepID=UPI001F2A7DA2|nr:hypothetical protein [Hirschia baltica]